MHSRILILNVVLWGNFFLFQHSSGLLHVAVILLLSPWHNIFFTANISENVCWWSYKRVHMTYKLKEFLLVLFLELKFPDPRLGWFSWWIVMIFVKEFLLYTLRSRKRMKNWPKETCSFLNDVLEFNQETQRKPKAGKEGLHQMIWGINNWIKSVCSWVFNLLWMDTLFFLFFMDKSKLYPNMIQCRSYTLRKTARQ